MVQTRFKLKVAQYFGATSLPLILASTDLEYLLCKDAYDKTQSTSDLALAVTKQVAFILGANKLLTNIRRKCMKCRQELAKTIKQRMGDMPEELQWPDAAFKNMGLDLAGPKRMKADVRRRSGRHDEGKVKIWIVIIVCSSTSAVKLYLARDNSEDDFLQAWAQHVADLGDPHLVYSFRGSQLDAEAGGSEPT